MWMVTLKRPPRLIELSFYCLVLCLEFYSQLRFSCHMLFCVVFPHLLHGHLRSIRKGCFAFIVVLCLWLCKYEGWLLFICESLIYRLPAASQFPLNWWLSNFFFVFATYLGCTQKWTHTNSLIVCIKLASCMVGKLVGRCCFSPEVVIFFSSACKLFLFPLWCYSDCSIGWS